MLEDDLSYSINMQEGLINIKLTFTLYMEHGMVLHKLELGVDILGVDFLGVDILRVDILRLTRTVMAEVSHHSLFVAPSPCSYM